MSTPARPPSAPWYVGYNGATVNTRQEAQRFCRDICSSAEYQTKFRERAVKGELPAAIESLMWYYAYGKPPEQVDLNVSADMSSMTTEQLQLVMREALTSLDAARRAEADLADAELNVQGNGSGPTRVM